MPTNVLSGTGLVFSRNRNALSPTFQANQYKIKNGSAIGIGDLVKTGTGASQGDIVLATSADTNILGVFNGVLPYFDKTLQAISNGLIGCYPASANSSAGIDCLVYDDLMSIFRDWLGFIGTGICRDGN